MSFTLPVPLVQKTYTLSPTLLSLRPVPVAVPATIPTGITLETVVQEPKIVEVKKVEKSEPVVTTTTTTTTTTEVKEVKPVFTSAVLWPYGPINFFEVKQSE